MSKRKAIFIDRDGVLNDMTYDSVHGLLDSPRKPDQVYLIKGAADFLKGVRELGYYTVVVTNQPGIAKGTLSEEDLVAVNQRLADLLKEGGASWDELRHSPFHPDGGPMGREEYIKSTACRKPEPGMLLDAAKEADIDLAASWMIGDGLTDVQAGRSAGCKTILLTKLKISHIEAFLDLEGAHPDYIAATMIDALDVIRSHSKS